MSDMVVPANMEVVFEHFCRDCEISEPVIIDQLIGETIIHRVICNNSQICQKVRTIAATEKAKEYPFV